MYTIRSTIDPELEKRTELLTGVYRFLFGRNINYWSVSYEKKVATTDCKNATDVINKLTEEQKGKANET